MTKLPRNVAFLDIGTNSIRLLLVRIDKNHSITTLTQQKEVVRLGEDEFIEQKLQPPAMQRAALVCQKFCEMARSRLADEIIAVATSATREAINQQEFIDMLKEKAHIKVLPVSGEEEARLIYLGVASGLHLGEHQALFIDIGGGSTELIVGNQQQYQELASMRMGAIRLASVISLPKKNGVVDVQDYMMIRNTIQPQIKQTVLLFQPYQLDMAIGSSGTIINLAEISSRMFYKRRLQQDDVMTAEELKATIQLLCSRDLEERRLIPGINPERADIIIPGAAILDVLMEEMHLPSITISQRGLRDGLLVDYLTYNQLQITSDQLTVRERSVLQLARTGMVDEVHAEQVRRLSLQIFDSAGKIGLHHLDIKQRELLGYAAFLHDVGAFLSYNNHNAHSYYLIHNAELLGFDQTEISVMASTAFYHRKGLPNRKQPQFSDLGPTEQEAVKIMSMFLRLGESLDRSHRSAVTKVTLSKSGEKNILLDIEANKDDQLEIWGAENHKAAFKKTFGLNLIIRQAIFNSK
jgi:exopolyphosphatase/guanosine-5'-triphosphate,3'-diphosphate pyrophosphatase